MSEYAYLPSIHSILSHHHHEPVDLYFLTPYLKNKQHGIKKKGIAMENQYNTLRIFCQLDTIMDNIETAPAV